MNDSALPDPNGASAASGQSAYLDRLMRRESFAALWPLFAKGEKPAKEMTESFSALEHLRPLIREGEPLRVLHIGDGAHARTAALFSIKTGALNISVDPQLNEPLVEAWRDLFGIARFESREWRIQDAVEELRELPRMRPFRAVAPARRRGDPTPSLLPRDAALTLP